VKNVLRYSYYILSITLAVAIFIPGSNCYAQNQLRIYEDIGGSSSSTNGSSSSDNTFIYVAGGLLVAGILAYALFLKKDNKEETDTTSVSIVKEFNNSDILEGPFYEVAKEKLPVDIFFGIRNDEAVLQNKTYLLGITFKL
jgi:hypothetical protein